MHIVIYLASWNTIHNILLNFSKNKPAQGTAIGSILYIIEHIHVQLNTYGKISKLTVAILGANFSLLPIICKCI